jgi:ribosome-associated protein
LLSKDRALLCAGYALEKKALNVRVLNVRGLSSLTDYLVVAGGQSDRQVQAIAESVRVGLKLHHDLPPMAVDGVREGRWVLLDYGDVMVHVFHEPVRDYYDLDGLWREAFEVPVPEDNPAVHKG